MTVYILNNSYHDSDAFEEEPTQHTALVATPKRRSKATLIGHSDSREHATSQLSDIHNIDHLEASYMPGKFLLDKEGKMRSKFQDERLESCKALILEGSRTLLVHLMKIQRQNQNQNQNLHLIRALMI